MPEVKEGGEFWFGKNGPPILLGLKINLDSIINDQKTSGYIIRFAQQLKNRRYIHPREFFEYLNKYELQELIDVSGEALVYLRRSQSDYDKYYSSAIKITTCSALLAKAEGESIIPVPLVDVYTSNFINLLLLHKLNSENSIKAKYENFTVLGTNKELFDAVVKDETEQEKQNKEQKE